MQQEETLGTYKMDADGWSLAATSATLMNTDASNSYSDTGSSYVTGQLSITTEWIERATTDMKEREKLEEVRLKGEKSIALSIDLREKPYRCRVKVSIICFLVIIGLALVTTSLAMASYFANPIA